MELYNFVTCLGYEGSMVIGKGKNNARSITARPKPWPVGRQAGQRPTRSPHCVDSAQNYVRDGLCGQLPAIATRDDRPRSNAGNGLKKVFALIRRWRPDPVFPGAVGFVRASSDGWRGVLSRCGHFAHIRPTSVISKVGQGKYFTTTSRVLEAPISIAQGSSSYSTTLAPLDRPVADIMTIAKRNLQPGETLDDFGGFMVHGVMDRAEVVRELNALPVGLAPGAQVVRPVAAGAVVTWEDVKLDEASTVVKLRRQQDQL